MSEEKGVTATFTQQRIEHSFSVQVEDAPAVGVGRDRIAYPRRVEFSLSWMRSNDHVTDWKVRQFDVHGVYQRKDGTPGNSACSYFPQWDSWSDKDWPDWLKRIIEQGFEKVRQQ